MAPPTAPQIWLRPLTSTGSIRFWWYPPVDDGGSAITGYTLTDGTITIDNIGPGSADPSIFRTYTVDSLTDGQDYTFSLIAHNADGDSPPATFRTVQPGGKATITQNATYNFINSSNALVEWEAPADTGGSAIGWYVIQVSDGVTTIKKSAHGYDRQLLVKDLNQYSSYTITVNAVNDAAYAPAATASNVTPVVYTIAFTSYVNPVDPLTNTSYEVLTTGLSPIIHYLLKLKIGDNIVDTDTTKGDVGGDYTWRREYTTPNNPGGSYQLTAVLVNDDTHQDLISTTSDTIHINAPNPATITINASGDQYQAQTLAFTISVSGNAYTYTGDQWYIDSTPYDSNTNGVFSHTIGTIGSNTIGYTVTTSDYGTITATPLNLSIAPYVSTDFPVGLNDPITPYIGDPTNFYVTQSYVDTPTDAQWYLDDTSIGETGTTYTHTFNDTNAHYVRFTAVISGTSYSGTRTVNPIGPIITFSNVSPNPVNPISTVTYDIEITDLFEQTVYHISGDYTTSFTTGVGETTKTFTGLTVTSVSQPNTSFPITINLNTASDVLISTMTYIVYTNPIPTLNIVWDQSQATKQGDVVSFAVSANGASYTYTGDEWFIDGESVATDQLGGYHTSFSKIGQYVISCSTTTTEFGVLNASATVYIVPNITYDTLTPTVGVATNFYVTQQYTVTPSLAFWILDGITTDPLETGSTYTVTFTDTNPHTVAYNVNSDFTYFSAVTVNPVNP
jgi:Fibronectin type III domain